MNLEELSSVVRLGYMETNGGVCCVCGCEKNEDFDDLVPCVCGASLAVLHQSCAAACKESTTSKLPPARCPQLPCLICGGQALRNGGTNDSKDGANKPAPAKQVDTGVGMKRPIKSCQATGQVAKRSRVSENGTVKAEDNPESQPGNSYKIKNMAQAADTEPKESDSGKSSVALLGRRYNDTPAIVPIKKRRFQIAEVMRSPSPPPRSPSPQNLSPPPRSASLQTISSRRSSPGSKSPSALPTSPSRSPFPRSPVPRSRSLTKSLSPPRPASPLQRLALSGSELNTAEGTMTTPFHDIGAAEVKGQSVVLLASSSSHSQNSYKIDESHDEQQAITSAKECHRIEDDDMVGDSSEGFSEEANGHCSQDAMNQDGIDRDASPERLQGELLRSESSSFSRDDRLHWDLNTDMAAWDTLTEQDTGKNCEDEEGAETHGISTSTASDESSHGNGKNDHVDDGIKEEVEEEQEIDEYVTCRYSEYRQVDDHSSVEKEEASPPAMQTESVWKAEDVTHHLESNNPISWDGEMISGSGEVCEKSGLQDHQDEIPEKHMSKFQKQAKSPSDDAEGWNHTLEEPEAEEHVDYGDSDCRDADDMGLDVDDRTSLMQDENWKAEDGNCNNECGKLTPWEGEAVSDAGETLVKASSHDDELSERSREKRATSGRSRPTGWDQLPEGYDNAEEALKAAKEISSRRGGRGGSWASPGGRGSLSSSHAASRFGPGHGTSLDRFSAGRADSFFGDRHPDDVLHDRDSYSHGRRMDDSFSAHNAVRGRNPGRRAGIFGRGRVGGWIDTQPGPMNQWGPGRHRPTSGFGGPANAAAVAAARVENSGFIVAPDGTITKSGSVIVPGRGGIRSTVSGSRGGGRGALVQVGRGPPVDMDAGAHYSMRAGVGTDRITGMNVGGRGLGPGSGPGFVSAMHDRGGSAGRGLMDRYRGGGMESGRSKSPRRPTHPLDQPNSMSRMPSMRPDSRVVRSRTPPSSHRSLSHSEFASARSQRSPPSSSRWSTDKREVDSYRDRDFKRPLSRSHAPPQRTSPHVVHGSSLTDERDRQVLAGTRNSPSLKGSLSSAYTGKSGDCGLEARWSKRSEDEDIRHTGSHSKDGDHGRGSPRESDKDRDKGSSYKREREREDDRRRDSHRSSSKDDRSTGGHKHAITREADDDVAPRRRRPS